MRDLVRVAIEVQKVLEKKRWKFCFIGGIAVQKWGQVRLTPGIDLTIFTGIGDETRFIDELLKTFKARIPDARSFARRNRVVLLQTRSRVDLDISCGAVSFEQSAIDRARKVQIRPGSRLKLCTADDLIVYKAFAGRPLDWADVESVIAKTTWQARLGLHLRRAGSPRRVERGCRDRDQTQRPSADCRGGVGPLSRIPRAPNRDLPER